MPCKNHVDELEGVLPCTRCGESYCGDCLVTIHGRPFCASCKSEQVLDIQSGVGSELRLATIGRRLAARFLDGGIFWGTWFVGVMLTAAFLDAARRSGPESFLATFLITGALVFLGLIAYDAIMISVRGQTLGKMALRIKVVRPDGSPVSAGQAWGRALMRGVMIHILGLVNYIPAFVTKQKTCIHDLVANTRVVNLE